MKKKLALFLLVAMLSIFAAACGSNNEKDTASKDEDKKTEEITVKHQLGEAKVKVNPKNVVVFDMGTLDTLDKLGVEVAAVPHDGLPKYLSKYESAKNAGGLKEPDFEAINALNPELILISGRQSEAYEELNKIAPTVFVGVDTTKYVESLEENITLLGKIFGKEKEAADELVAVEEKMNSVKALAPTGKKGLIILTSGGKISAYGPASRFGLIHDVLGVPAVDEKLDASTPHGQSISPEYIAEKNPDYLFVVDRDAVVDGGESTAKATVENNLIKNTNAYKNGKIIYLDPQYWYLSGGGLESLDKMISDIESAVK